MQRKTIQAMATSSVLLFVMWFAGLAQAQQIVGPLGPLQVADIDQGRDAFVLRIAEFSESETNEGHGAPILLLSADARQVVIYLRGQRTEMKALQQIAGNLCQDGGVRQLVYAADKLRLMAKLSFTEQRSVCSAQGLVSVHLDKHTYRYLVKASRHNRTN
ncbi:hypothetical protein [Undibacterium fentianense]|uniref:Uncharacterized protein n=1 Tax=Undibacterium fentianense TaxID=2828728 RepID=A0A941E1R9_9BURK|nr:hypothetical protein [Undibacterium fentianense]MBR7800800.1 hypothetical protein [Undibacterium fentianense]